jgi:hypothetical protein
VVIDTPTAARAWLTLLERHPGPFGFDTETEGIDPRSQPAAGDHGRIVCFTVAVPTGELGGRLSAQAYFFWATPEIVDVIGPWWSTAPVVGHNLYGFDAHLCRRAGFPLGNIRMDTLRAHRLLDTSTDAEHGLKPLMARYLRIDPVGKFEELFTRRKCLEEVPAGELKTTRRNVGDEPKVPTLVGGAHSRFGELTELVPLSEIRTTYTNLLPALIEYACLDAIATLQLWKLFDARLRSTRWELPCAA